MTPPESQGPEDKTETSDAAQSAANGQSKESPRDDAPAEQKAAGEKADKQETQADGKPPAEAKSDPEAKPAAEKKPAGEDKPAAAKKAAAERPARPAREAEPKGAPRNPPPPGSINEVLSQAVPGVELTAYMVPAQTGEAVAVEVGRDNLKAVMTAAHNDPRLDLRYLRSLSGVDWQDEGLEVVYHLWSFTKRHELTVKTRISLDDPVVPSVTDLYPAANWHERETRDMFGITFEGHPNLVPMLLPEDMTDHFPLRKENPLQEIEEWQGENLREGAEEGEE